jgi:hypothetical protein
MKMEHTECSETSAYIIQAPGNYPEESIQHSEQGESLKSRIHTTVLQPIPTCGPETHTIIAEETNQLRISERELVTKIYGHVKQGKAGQ